ncbi:MAG TPA: hypothetical protein VI958_04860, partial [Acidobacteriota bacterium]
EDERFLKSATQRIPLLLQAPPQKASSRSMDTDLLNRWMSELKNEFAPLPRPAKSAVRAPVATIVAPPAVELRRDPLERQLSLLKVMFENQDRKDFRLNFDYITQRSLHLMRHGRFDDLGDVKLLATLQDRAEAISARWH